MSVPETLSSLRPRATRFFWSTLWALITGDIIVGLGFIFQLPANTPTFRAIDSVIPLEVLGGMLIMAAGWYVTGLWTGRRQVMVIGLSLASFVNGVFAIAFLAALFTGSLLGFPSIAIWGAFSLIHFFGVLNMPPTSAIRELKHARFGK